MNMPVTQLRRLRLPLDLDKEEGNDPWWNNEWETKKGKPFFWERMQDPEDLWKWQTNGKMRG